MHLSLERFAWNGLRDLYADIALDELSEEAAVDVLAQFLWTYRHVATTQEECQRRIRRAGQTLHTALRLGGFSD